MRSAIAMCIQRYQYVIINTRGISVGRILVLEREDEPHDLPRVDQDNPRAGLHLAPSPIDPTANQLDAESAPRTAPELH